MAALSEDVKRFIVQALACFDSPKQVAESVKDEFGIVVTRQQCEAYDPTKYVGRSLSKKWRTLFDATREEWRKGTAEVPIANRIHRLRMLDRFANKAASMKNIALAMAALEQAAKEVGDVYTNRRMERPRDAPAEPTAPSEDYRLPLSPDEDVPGKPIL